MEKQSWTPTPQELLSHVRQSAETSLEYQESNPIHLHYVVSEAKKGTGKSNEVDALRQIFLEERMTDIWSGHIHSAQSPQELTTILMAMGEWVPTIAGRVQKHNRGAQASTLTKELLRVSGQFVIKDPESAIMLGQAWRAFMPQGRDLISESMRAMIKNEAMKYATSTFEQDERQNYSFGALQMLSELTDQKILDSQFWLNTLSSLGQHISMDFLEVVGDRLLQDKPIQGKKQQSGALSRAAGNVICYALERAANDPNRRASNAQSILDFITTDQQTSRPMFSFNKIVAVANTIIDQKNSKLPQQEHMPKLKREIDNFPLAFAITLEATRKGNDERQVIEDEILTMVALELLALSDQQAEIIPRTMGALAVMFPDATNEELVSMLREDSITSRSRQARLYRLGRSQISRQFKSRRYARNPGRGLVT